MRKNTHSIFEDRFIAVCAVAAISIVAYRVSDTIVRVTSIVTGRGTDHYEKTTTTTYYNQDGEEVKEDEAE